MIGDNKHWRCTVCIPNSWDVSFRCAIAWSRCLHIISISLWILEVLQLLNLTQNNISSKKPSKAFRQDENLSTERNKTSLQHKSCVGCSSVLWTSERDESGHHLCRRNKEPGGATDRWAANVRRPDVHWRTTSGDLWRPWNGGRSNHQGGRSCQDWEIRPSSDEQSGLLEPETSWGFWTWLVIKKFHHRIHPNLVFTWFLQF